MQWVGYAAATLVFCSFAMRTMLPLRLLAIASNVAFIGYALPLRLWPIVVLHGLLLPMNLLRLRQLLRMLKSLRAASVRDIDVAPLLAHLEHVRRQAGTMLFRKGDAADCAYYIAEGEVDFPERSDRLGPGNFFGEDGLFAAHGLRTGSACCASDVALYRIRQRDLVAAFHGSPSLAIALVRLIASRMSANLTRADELVRSGLQSAASD